MRDIQGVGVGVRSGVAVGAGVVAAVAVGAGVRAEDRPDVLAERFAREILPAVSRTFALSIRVLPGGDYGFAWNPIGTNARDIQTFVEIQRRLQEQSVPKFGDNPILNAEAWSQFVKMQGPTIQGLMSSYLDQSATTFLDMQQQLQKQARSIFGNFPFGNNLTGAAGESRPGTPSAEPETFKQPQKKAAS